MILKIKQIPLLMVIMLLSIGMFCQFQANAALLFSDDFEDGNTTGWSKSNGTWAVVTDGSKVIKQSALSTTAYMYTGQSSWANYTVQAKVKVLSFNGTDRFAGVCARYTSTSNFYFARLVSSNRLEIAKKVGGNVNVLASKAFTVTTGNWYTLGLTVNGTTLSCSVNGTTELTATDSSLSSGKIGITTMNASAEFDDIAVNDIIPQTSPTPTITSGPTSTVEVSPSVSPSLVPVETPVTGAYYVAPNGNDSNPGTIVQPFYSISRAIAVAGAPGSTIYVRGGTYQYSATILLSVSGTAAAPIKIIAYPGEKPVLDFSKQPYASSNRAFNLTGNYWYIKGLEICYAGDNGIKLEGSYNTIELCVFHHNGDSGIQLGFAHETENPNGTMCAYNTIINCDSYLNFDFDNMGSDADGFACKMHNGKGNKFVGCRAWRNSDDGWDLFETDWPVEIINCWAWHSGDKADFDAIYQQKMGKTMSSFQGNGNGIKLGGNGTGGSSKGTHIVKNCVVFDCYFKSKKGFDQNNHKGGVILHNCTAWGNGYNYMFEESASNGGINEIKNCVSFAVRGSLDHEFASDYIQANNSWNLSVTADASDFSSLAEELAKAPRQADGSLPNNGFARLVSGSDLINKGVNVGLPYLGSAPDLGAFERE
ncbi:MAG TPA: family 16 glycoside hydrolase [Bacillota bacterium]|nr:family 16 glycoside hydrolase [Bacillota bacterium]